MRQMVNAHSSVSRLDFQSAGSLLTRTDRGRQACVPTQRRTWQDRFDAVEVAADNELPVTESPFSYQKFPPKIFYLPFEHMHVILNIVKK